MNEIIGTVKSEQSSVNYEVKLDKTDGSVYIKRPNTFGWMKAGEEAKTELEAMQKARTFIESRPGIF